MKNIIQNGRNDTPSLHNNLSVKRMAFKKIGKIILLSVLSLILLFNLITITVSSLGLRRSLNYLPCAFVTIESGSMEPALHKGDLIFVYRTSFRNLKVGDVITYYSGEEFITHGITEIQNEEVIAKGLQNELADNPIGEKEYCAKMIFAITGGEALWNLLNEFWFTFVLLFIIVFACYGVPFLSFIYDKLSKDKETKGKKKIGVCRVLTSLVLASVVFVTPFLSSAKYKSEIGGFILSSSESVYFKSNYLSQEGSNYYVNGWAGLGTDLSLEIRNWTNQLLYNESEDVKYIIKVEKKSAEAQYELATGGYQVGQTFFERTDVYTEYQGTVKPTEPIYTKEDDVYTETSDFTYGNTYYTKSVSYTVYEGRGQGTVPPLYKRTQKGYTTDYSLTIRNQAYGYEPAEYQVGSSLLYYYDVYTEFVPDLNPDVPVPTELYELINGTYHLATYVEGNTFYTHSIEQYTWDGVSEIPMVYVRSAGVYGPFTIGAGKVKNQTYDVTLSSTREQGGETVPLNPGESIQFVITAETVSTNYHQTLTGTFSMDVASSTSFLGEGQIEEENNSSVAKYTLYTNRIAGSAFREVQFSWNIEELDINRLISPVWDYINQDATCYVVDNTTKKATLTVTMQAPAMISFQFFKADETKQLTVEDIVSEEETDYITFSLKAKENPG